MKSIILLAAMAIGPTLIAVPCIAADAAYCWNCYRTIPACFHGADWRWNANWSRLCNWRLNAPFSHARAEPCFRNLTLGETKLLVYGRY